MKKRLFINLTIPVLLLYHPSLPCIYNSYRVSIVAREGPSIQQGHGEQIIVVKNYRKEKKRDAFMIEQRLLLLQETYKPITNAHNTDLGNLLSSMAGTITYASKFPADHFNLA